MRERDERLIDRLIQKNLDGREGTAMRSRIDRADTTHRREVERRTPGRCSNYNPAAVLQTRRVLVEVVLGGRQRAKHNAGRSHSDNCARRNFSP